MSLRIALLILLSLLFAAAPASAVVLDSYSGKVVDAETGAPLKGATVVVSWDKATPTPAGAVHDFIEAVMCETGEDGRYRIPGKITWIGVMSFVDGVTFLAYQPGYAGFSKTYYDEEKIEETQVIKLQRLSGMKNEREIRREFENGIFRIQPGVYDRDGDLDPHVRFKALLKGEPEREVLRARGDWERLFRREE